MKTTLTLIAAAAALGLGGAAVAQTDNSTMGNTMTNGSSMSGKKMHHSKHMKTAKPMATDSDTNGMRGADTGSANGASPNGGMAMPTAPGNTTTPQ